MRTRRIPPPFLLVGLCLLGVPATARAQDVHVSATVNERQVVLGDSLELSLTVEGTQDVTPPDLHLDGFAVQYRGPSTYVAVVNGRISSSITHIYALMPQQVGTLTIGPIAVRAGNQTLQTDPVTVEVLPASARPRRALAPLGQAGGSDDEEALDHRAMIRDALQLQLGVDKTRAYVNEEIPARLQLLVGGVSVRGIDMPTIQADGFLVRPLGQPKQSSMIVNGQSQTLLEFETVVIPIRPGTLTLGPASMNCQVVARRRPSASRSRGAGSDPFGELFGDGSLFDEFFGQARLYSVQAQAQPVTIEVLPLPEDGKPAGFQGAVGHFTLDVTAVPSRVAVGEPVTMTMTVRGQGNLDTVTPPQLVGDTSAFKVYDPQARKPAADDKTPDEKVFEQVLIPIDPSVQALPAVQLITFNPQTGRYETLTHPPIPLVVTPAPAQQPVTVVDRPQTSAGASSTQPPQPEVLGRDIVYIKERPGPWHRRDQPWYADLRWIGLLSAAVLVLLGSEGGRWYRERLSADPGAARASGALKRALAHCHAARRLKQEGKTIDGYAQVFRAVQRYVGDRLNVSSSGLTKAELERLLRARGVADDVLTQLTELLDRCDAARFAPMSVANEQLEATVQSAESILRKLERWKPA